MQPVPLPSWGVSPQPARRETTFVQPNQIYTPPTSEVKQRVDQMLKDPDTLYELRTRGMIPKDQPQRRGHRWVARRDGACNKAVGWEIDEGGFLGRKECGAPIPKGTECWRQDGHLYYGRDCHPKQVFMMPKLWIGDHIMNSSEFANNLPDRRMVLNMAQQMWAIEVAAGNVRGDWGTPERAECERVTCAAIHASLMKAKANRWEHQIAERGRGFVASKRVIVRHKGGDGLGSLNDAGLGHAQQATLAKQPEVEKAHIKLPYVPSREALEDMADDMLREAGLAAEMYDVPESMAEAKAKPARVNPLMNKKPLLLREDGNFYGVVERRSGPQAETLATSYATQYDEVRRHQGRSPLRVAQERTQWVVIDQELAERQAAEHDARIHARLEEARNKKVTGTEAKPRAKATAKKPTVKPKKRTTRKG